MRSPGKRDHIRARVLQRSVFADCVITVVGFKRIRMKHHSHRFGGAALLTQHIDGFGHVN